MPALEAFNGSGQLLVVSTGGNQTAELRDRFPQFNIIIGNFIPFAGIMPQTRVYITKWWLGWDDAEHPTEPADDRR